MMPGGTMRKMAAIGLGIVLGGCAMVSARADPMAMPKKGWRAMATQPDRDRLRNWHDAWKAALARARTTNAAQIDADPDLFDPDHALPGALPPAGAYSCRVFKLGAKGTAMAEYTAYEAAKCQIDAMGKVSSFAKMTGLQRPSGVIFQNDPARAIFLGSMKLGDETRSMDHGRDAGRDVTGYIERIGDKRWRLVLPYPRFESILDVIELVPAA